MDSKDKEIVEQQKLRKQRVNRIKTSIIMTIAIWMVVSLLAIVVLGVVVVKLNSRIYKIELQINSAISSSVKDDESSKNSDWDNGIVSEVVVDSQNSEVDTSSVVRQLDSEDNVYHEGNTRKVYLTFDSVPGDNTNAILDALAQHDVKATFFVIGDVSGQYDDVYKRIVDEGHTIAMHSYSNSYSQVYDSKEAFSDDLAQISEYISNLTGVAPSIYRFPGGSMNQISNVAMEELVHILNEQQIVYYDWNVSAGDTSVDYSVDDIVDNVMAGVVNYNNSVVLLHDDSTKSTTADAIGSLVEALENIDAEILPIDEDTYVVQYIKADTVG